MMWYIDFHLAALKAHSQEPNEISSGVHWNIHSADIDWCAVTVSPDVFRQHGLDLDPEEQLQQSAEEHLPRACGHLGRRVPDAKQHQHPDGQGVHLRPRGQHEAVQRRGAHSEGGTQHGSLGGHFALCHHPAQWVQTVWDGEEVHLKLNLANICFSNLILIQAGRLHWKFDLSVSWSCAREHPAIANRPSQVLKRPFCISLLNVIHRFLWADNSASDRSWHVNLIWTAKQQRSTASEPREGNITHYCNPDLCYRMKKSDAFLHKTSGTAASRCVLLQWWFPKSESLLESYAKLEILCTPGLNSSGGSVELLCERPEKLNFWVSKHKNNTAARGTRL